MRVPAVVVVVLAAAACSSPSPDPRALAEREIAPAAREEDRQAAAALAAEAVAALEAGKFAIAADAAARALTRNPADARARAARGLVRQHESQQVTPPDLFLQNEGEGLLLQAVKLAPADALVARMHAQFLMRLGHLSAAADAAERGLAAAAPGPERNALLAVAADLRFELGEERAALGHYRELTDLHPDNPAIFYRYGFCRLAEAVGEVQDDAAAVRSAVAAVAAFKRAVELAPGDIDAAGVVGKALRVAGERARAAGQGEAAQQLWQESVSASTDAARRFADVAEPLFDVGLAQEALGNQELAVAAYEQALARDNSHLGSLLNLASLVSTKDPARAKELLQQALQVGGRALSASERQRIEQFVAGK